MGYVVAVDFIDVKDGNRLYRTGDQFPRPGLIVSEARLAELAGSDNRVGYPLIKDDGTEKKTTRKRVNKRA